MLRNRGVYGPKGRKVRIAKSLYQVVQDELTWPEQDSEKFLDEQVKGRKISHGNDAQIVHRPHASSDAQVEGQEPRPRHGGELLETSVLSSRGEAVHNCFRHSHMGNLFKLYGNDQDKYSGATTDSTESLCYFSKDVISPISK